MKVNTNIDDKLAVIAGTGAYYDLIEYKSKKIGLNVVKCSKSETPEYLEKYKPDVILYTCMYDHKRDLQRVRQYHEKYPDTLIIAGTYCGLADYLDALEDAGAMCSMTLPISADRMAMLLRHLMMTGEDSLIPRIADFMLMRGFKWKLKGFLPTCYLVEMVCKNPEIISKNKHHNCWNEVSEAFGAKSVNVEAVVRNLARIADRERILAKLSDHTFWKDPTNWDLITIVTDAFLTHYRRMTFTLSPNAKIVPADEIVMKYRSKDKKQKKDRRWKWVGRPETDRGEDNPQSPTAPVGKLVLTKENQLRWVQCGIYGNRKTYIPDGQGGSEN